MFDTVESVQGHTHPHVRTHARIHEQSVWGILDNGSAHPRLSPSAHAKCRARCSESRNREVLPAFRPSKARDGTGLVKQIGMWAEERGAVTVEPDCEKAEVRATREVGAYGANISRTVTKNDDSAAAAVLKTRTSSPVSAKVGSRFLQRGSSTGGRCSPETCTCG